MDTNPSKFLTSGITSSLGSAAIAPLGGAAKGALTGFAIGSMLPVPGANLAAAGIGAVLGGLKGASDGLAKIWDKLGKTSNVLVNTFAKFSATLSAQQAKQAQSDLKMQSVWAKALTPLLKDVSQFSLRFKELRTHIRVSTFKNFEEVIKKVVAALKVLGTIGLATAEFFAKLSSMLKDLVGHVLAPLLTTFKLLGDAIMWLLKKLGYKSISEEQETAGVANWSAGTLAPYGKGRSGARGGDARLPSGKFNPETPTPAWAEEKMEFGFMKEWKEKSWLSKTMDMVRNLIPETLTMPKIGINRPEGSKGRTGPVTEEDKENYRKEHNLPSRAPEPQGSGIPGPLGQVMTALGSSVIASVPSKRTPTIRIPKEEKGKKPSDKTEYIKHLAEASQAIKDSEPGPEREAAYDAFTTIHAEGAPLFKTAEASKAVESAKKTFDANPNDETNAALKSAEEKLATIEAATRGEAESPKGAEDSKKPKGGVIMQILDSNQLLDMLSFSWEEIRVKLRQQQADYSLLKYRMQAEGTYL